jgi:hypothetical protein
MVSVPPLLSDLKAELPAIRRLAPAILAFGALLLVADRLVAGVLTTGLERFYGLDRPAEVLVVGHSHIVLGVDHELLARETGLRVAKYARQGATLADRQIMIRQYLARHPGVVRVVVLGVDSHSLTAEGLSRNSFRLFLPFRDEPVVAAYLERFEVTALERLLHEVLHTSRFEETTLALAVRGIRGDWRSYKNSVVTDVLLRRHLERYTPIRTAADQEAILAGILGEVEQHGAHTVLTFLPTIHEYNAREPDQFARMLEFFRETDRTHASVTFLDYVTPYAQRREIFFDPIHLNRRGQIEVTARLAVDVLASAPGGSVAN